jgi:hypothetical protein
MVLSNYLLIFLDAEESTEQEMFNGAEDGGNGKLNGDILRN